MVVIVPGCALLVTHNMTSYSCLQINIFATFVDTIHILFYTRSPYSFLYNVSLYST